MTRLGIAVLVVVALFGLPTIAAAQTRWAIEWDQDAADLATVSAATYNAYLDANAAVPLVTTCIAKSAGGFVCTAPLPPLSPAQHEIALSAQNAAGESPRSPSVTFSVVLIPVAPSGIRLIPIP